MRIKNKKVRKLRLYRDKLLVAKTTQEGEVRLLKETLRQIRKALQKEDTLRAYALASDDQVDIDPAIQEYLTLNEATKELTLVYRFLSVERKFTEEVHVAANHRDYLRVAAICADHKHEFTAHDRMLNEWSRDHGFTRTLKKEMEDEDVI